MKDILSPYRFSPGIFIKALRFIHDTLLPPPLLFCQLLIKRTCNMDLCLDYFSFHFLFFMRHTDDETRRHGARVDLMDFFFSFRPPFFFFFSVSYFRFDGVVWVSLDWGVA